jgi:hypothetical protein
MRHCSVIVLALVVMACAACRPAEREAVRSQVGEIAKSLRHPPDSTVILTADDLIPPGSSETCHGSDRFYLIGSPLSQEEIRLHYDAQLSSETWLNTGNERDHSSWSRSNGRYSQALSIVFRGSLIEYLPSYREAIPSARAQFPTVYVLGIIVYTGNTCKG